MPLHQAAPLSQSLPGKRQETRTEAAGHEVTGYQAAVLPYVFYHSTTCLFYCHRDEQEAGPNHTVTIQTSVQTWHT